MTRHTCSTSSSSLNLQPSDCESHATSPCSSSSSPVASPTPPHDDSSINVGFELSALKQRPESNFGALRSLPLPLPLPPPPSAHQAADAKSSTKLLSTSQSFIRRRWKSVSAAADDPFVLALKRCTVHRWEEGEEKASGLHSMFMGLLKAGRKTYGDVAEAPKSTNPLLNLLQFSTFSKKKQVVLSDLLGCKTTVTSDLHFNHVVHPSLIYRKRRFKPIWKSRWMNFCEEWEERERDR